MSANAIFKEEEDFFKLPNNATMSKVYRGKKSGKKIQWVPVKHSRGRRRGNRNSDNHWLQQRSAEYKETSRTSLTVLLRQIKETKNPNAKKIQKSLANRNKRAAQGEKLSGSSTNR